MISFGAECAANILIENAINVVGVFLYLNEKGLELS